MHTGEALRESTNGRSHAHLPATNDTEAEALRVELDSYRHWIKRVVDVCNEAARGNLEERLINVEAPPDIRELATLINRLLDITDAFVRESRASLEHASQGKFYRRVLLRGLLGTFGSSAKVINAATADMKGQAEALRASEARRLTLADNFESAIMGVVSSVASAATQMRGTAEALSQTADGAADQATAVGAASEQSSANVASLAEATTSLTRAIGEIDDQVGFSKRNTQDAVRQTAETRSTVVHLSEASQKIGGVVALISKIASQTNLLALNATIEAARAGEAGRGFAVVASEVKNLAQKTAEATEEINSEIEAIQGATGKTVSAIENIAGSITEIDRLTHSVVDSVNRQREATTEISTNVKEAATATSEVAKYIVGVTSAIQETSEAVGQLLVAADDLSRQSESLRVSVNDFLVEIRS